MSARVDLYACPEPEADWPRCECGARFPSRYHLELHKKRTGCLGELEYARLYPRWWRDAA